MLVGEYRGDPLEGWSLQYRTSAEAAPSLYVCKGLMGDNGIVPTSVQDTSTSTRQSASWVGAAGPLKASISTNLGVTDMYFTTSVTLTNTGSWLTEKASFPSPRLGGVFFHTFTPRCLRPYVRTPPAHVLRFFPPGRRSVHAKC